MKSSSSRRVTHGALVIAGAAVALLAAVAPATASSDATVFTGAGRGPTAETAIQSAIWDAETSGHSMGLYDCEPVGEPQVWEIFDDPNYGHIFRAQADVSCE